MLTPQNANTQTQMRAFIEQASLDDSRALGVSLGTSTPVLTLPVLRYCLKQQPALSVLWKYRKHPIPARRWGISMARSLPLPPSLSRKSLQNVGEELKNIEAMLQSGQEYFFGKSTQADIMMAAHFHRLEEVALGAILEEEKLPNIAAA